METTLSHDQRITNTLLLNASFIDNLGLMHGKMGISIFFYQLARQTNNPIYEDYAGELIDEIYEEITINNPIDFENGLTGIGWGIEYLVQNGFIEADTEEVLEEFDNRIFKWLIYNTPQSIGLLNGLLGIGAYLLNRIQNPQSNDDKISTLTNKQSLIHLIDELDRRTQNVLELIMEPQNLSNKVKQHQTTETNGTKETISLHFDLLWDYTVLLWVLTEVYKQNILNFKVEKIINRLIEPLTSDKNLPKLHSNRLLLAVSLIRLHQTLETNPQSFSNVQTTETILTDSNHIKQLQNISNVLLASICGETIISELPVADTSLRNGCAGIAWIYHLLSEFSDEDTFTLESQHWIEKTNNAADLNNNQNSNNMESKLKSFGLLEGFAGKKLVSGLMSF